MKNVKSIWVVIAIVLLTTAMPGCFPTDDDNPIPGGNQGGDNGTTTENVDFLAYYKPSSDKVLGNDKLIAKISVKDGTLSYASFLLAYPEDGMTKNCDINNNIMVLGLDASDFDYNGAYMKLDEDHAYYLSLVEPSEESDYSYFQPSTGDVSDNGFILYSSATNDKNYGDEYQPYLLRYNPSDNTYEVAEGPNNFVLSQPEAGDDTEAGLIQRTLFISPNGKYAYGEVDGYGVDGGSYHWDYEILFRYDFDQKTYTRLGDTDDNDVTIVAMTSDRRYIIYSNGSTGKVLDLQTGNISTTNMNTVNVKKNSWGKNGCCVGASTGDLYYKDFVNNKEVIVCNTGWGWACNAMFSKNEDKIYFFKEGSDKNFLCVTSGISEGSTYDTIGSFPTEFYDIIMVK